MEWFETVARATQDEQRQYTSRQMRRFDADERDEPSSSDWFQGLLILVGRVLMALVIFH